MSIWRKGKEAERKKGREKCVRWSLDLLAASAFGLQGKLVEGFRFSPRESKKELNNTKLI